MVSAVSIPAQVPNGRVRRPHQVQSFAAVHLQPELSPATTSRGCLSCAAELLNRRRCARPRVSSCAVRYSHTPHRGAAPRLLQRPPVRGKCAHYGRIRRRRCRVREMRARWYPGHNVQVWPQSLARCLYAGADPRPSILACTLLVGHAAVGVCGWRVACAAIRSTHHQTAAQGRHGARPLAGYGHGHRCARVVAACTHSACPQCARSARCYNNTHKRRRGHAHM